MKQSLYPRAHALLASCLTCIGLASSAAAQKVYWTDYATGPSSGAIESLPIPAVGSPATLYTPQSHDVTIDAPNQVLYWTQNSSGTGYVMSGPATGGSPAIVAAQGGSAWKVAYVKDNSNQEWVFWTDVFAGGTVWRKNITTGAPNQLLPITTWHGIAIDKRPSQLKLYTSDSSGVIWKSDLAGGGYTPLTSGSVDPTSYGVTVHGLCVDADNNRLWVIGYSDVSHPGPTQSWIKRVNLSTGTVTSFLTSPLGQGDPVGVIQTQLVDIAYDCVANHVYWTAYDLNVQSTIRHASASSPVMSIYHQPTSGSHRFEGLALDSNAPCSQFQAFCLGYGSALACPCGNVSAEGSGQGCANSLGFGAILSATGTPSVSADSMMLRGELMPNSSALYFQGSAPQNAGLGTAFGDGLRCAGGSVLRLGTKINAGGASAYPLPGVDLPISVKGAVQPGDTRYYQIWYRNAAAFCTASTFNLSNGMQVEWGL